MLYLLCHGITDMYTVIFMVFANHNNRILEYYNMFGKRLKRRLYCSFILFAINLFVDL